MQSHPGEEIDRESYFNSLPDRTQDNMLPRDDAESSKHHQSDQSTPPPPPASISQERMEEMKCMFRMLQPELDVMVQDKDFRAAASGDLHPTAEVVDQNQELEHVVIQMEELKRPLTPIKDPPNPDPNPCKCRAPALRGNNRSTLRGKNFE